MTRGAFYFKLTDLGNLIGEYLSDDKDRRITTESANTIEPKDIKDFTGTYLSGWLENEKPYSTTLEIKPHRVKGRYILNWEPLSNGSGRFQGEGMLVDGILIGYYHSA